LSFGFSLEQLFYSVGKKFSERLEIYGIIPNLTFRNVGVVVLKIYSMNSGSFNASKSINFEANFQNANHRLKIVQNSMRY
jgi:hypothetical protein